MGDSAYVPRLQWIPSVFHPERRIARPTLLAMEAILRNTEDDLPRDTAVGDLAAIGGVARVEGPSGQAVAVARVGRDSLVGFRLTADGLAEVEVSVDAASGAIRITTDPTAPPASS